MAVSLPLTSLTAVPYPTGLPSEAGRAHPHSASTPLTSHPLPHTEGGCCYRAPCVTLDLDLDLDLGSVIGGGGGAGGGGCGGGAGGGPSPHATTRRELDLDLGYF